MVQLAFIINDSAWALKPERSMGDTMDTNTLLGLHAFDAELIKKIDDKKKMRGDSYKPRTRHLHADGQAKYTNRLFLESSPYLLQHAHNPVNWYPWCKEAFEEAKKHNRPVFVSIGYSTCHWCHVMEEESFEDEEIAACLNENFISIKIDREERPDIDAIYMAAIQALTGGGGWPLNVWLTHERKPFYGGTYFPPRDGGMGMATGFLTLLKKLNERFHSNPDLVITSSEKITDVIQKNLTMPHNGSMPGTDLLDRASQYYKMNYNPVYGGVTGAPKFPSSLPVRFLYRYYRRTGNKNILDMANHTLDKMSDGGIYDHVGGGFHRYATDEKWLVPHFEKMLYDNALLVVAYLEGYQVTGNNDYRRIVKETLDYVIHEMTSPEGAFYSATDADSLTPDGQNEEGYYFTWTHDEIDHALGNDTSAMIKTYYDVRGEPNFEGRYILHTPKGRVAAEEKLNSANESAAALVTQSKKCLYTARLKRPQPLRDEKIITSWNGLMISAFARAGLILDDRLYINTAIMAAEFILKHLYKDQKLLRIYKDDQAKYLGYLEDYVFFIAGLIDLFEATQDTLWLEKALELDKVLEGKYEDHSNGGFFMTSDEHEHLIAREKPHYDGAVPSGNSTAALNLLRLYEYTLDPKYKNRSEKILQLFIGSLSTHPATLSEMLLALDFYLDKPERIVIVTAEGRKSDAEIFMEEFRKQFTPNRTLTVVSEGKQIEQVSGIIPFVKDKTALHGQPTAYICENGECRISTSETHVFSEQMRKKTIH